MELLQFQMNRLKADNDTVVRALEYHLGSGEALPQDVRVRIAVRINFGDDAKVQLYSIPADKLTAGWNALVWFAKHQSDTAVNRACRYYIGSYMDDAWLPYQLPCNSRTLDVRAVLKYDTQWNDMQY